METQTNKTKTKEKNLDQKLLEQLNIFLDDVSDEKLSDELNSLFADNKYMQFILFSFWFSFVVFPTFW